MARESGGIGARARRPYAPAMQSEADDGSRRAVHALMSGLIDYAGLFPPAKLPMAEAAANYGRYVAGDDSWMLGRLVVPVSRLEEFRVAAAKMLPRVNADEPWPLSAIVDGDLDEDMDAVFAFNREHSRTEAGLAVVDAVEIKVPPEGGPVAAAFIDNALDTIPEGLYPFFEMPAPGSGGDGADSPDLRGCIAALAGADAAAKVRTGGLTPESIPGARAIAEFIVACAQAEVPFKATAGLHHAVRAEHPLTYEAGCPRALMHGFVNVFVAAAFVLTQRAGVDGATAVLEETDGGEFVFTESGIGWRGRVLDTSALERTREQFALSYGSCSFEEPVAELRSMRAV